MPRQFKNKIRLYFEVIGHDIPITLAQAIHRHCSYDTIIPDVYGNKEEYRGGNFDFPVTIRERQRIGLEFANFRTLISFMQDPYVIASLVLIDESPF